MPKLKTNSSAKKRFHVTKRNKIKRAKGWKSHLLEAKRSKRKRSLRKHDYVSKADEKRVKRMLPYA
ncbi:MAG: 50S ribosomal protein L35 [Spirochaetes bacterium]|nr:50S ribosomal protein L35 [Spirochaetota bacterium]